MCVWRGGLFLKRPEGDGDSPEVELQVVVSHLRQFLESSPLEELQSLVAIRCALVSLKVLGTWQ